MGTTSGRCARTGSAPRGAGARRGRRDRLPGGQGGSVQGQFRHRVHPGGRGRVGLIAAPWLAGCGRSSSGSAASGSGRRSAPRWPRTCTIRCCRRSTLIQRERRTTRARSTGWPAPRSASCGPGSTSRPQDADATLAARRTQVAARGRGRARGADRGRLRRRRAARRPARRDAAGGAARPWSTPPSTPARRRLASTPRSSGRGHVFVRDRGAGFDLDEVPDDRQGVRESIVGRMERHGGSARCAPARRGHGSDVDDDWSGA